MSSAALVEGSRMPSSRAIARARRMSFLISPTSNHASWGRSRTSGARSFSIGEPTALSVITSLASFRSTPSRSARSRPSENASICTARLMLMVQLERQSLTVLPDPGGRPEHPEDRLDTDERLLVPAHHDGERAGLYLGHAPGHRRVEHGRSTGPRSLGHVPARPRAHRAQVHPDLSRGEALQDPVGTGPDRLERSVVGDRREDDVSSLGDLARRVAPAQALLHQVLRVLPGTLLAEDLVPRGEEPSGHVAT